MSFPGCSDSKESDCNAGDLGLIPVLGRSPGGGQGNPLQYSGLDNPHGQRSLVDYSPLGGHKESDMTEQLSTAQTWHQQRREINSSNREVNFEHHNINTENKMKAAPRATVDMEKIGTI